MILLQHLPIGMHLEQVSNPAALSDQARAPWYYLYNTQYNTKYVLYTIHGVQRCIMLPWSTVSRSWSFSWFRRRDLVLIWCPLPSNTQIIQSGALNANSVDVVSQLAVVRRRDVHSVEDCCAKAESNNREPSSGPCRSQGAGEVGNATHCHRFQSRYYYYYY